ncbi:hypothetical protein J5N97_021904 [Dioscorea zingiberensis]|uniref:Dirigent protein n=1 Tax=Dioscorea zingiberensis TaxID=325984 RepID=A0A9D5CAG0_9LILI|nr:hypothetical protein J5N97_021904 [Dioscorea zingiberensis]
MKTMDTNHLHLLLLLLFPLNFVSQCHAEYHSIGKEKVTNLHFFYQETLKGDHPSAIVVATAKDNIVNNSSNQLSPFGTVLVIDDPLTEGPDPNSKVVGRAQGLAVSAGQEKLLFVFAMDFGFTSGEFNGSSLSVLSRNTVLETERELAVVGGALVTSEQLSLRNLSPTYNIGRWGRGVMVLQENRKGTPSFTKQPEKKNLVSIPIEYSDLAMAKDNASKMNPPRPSLARPVLRREQPNSVGYDS